MILSKRFLFCPVLLLAAFPAYSQTTGVTADWVDGEDYCTIGASNGPYDCEHIMPTPPSPLTAMVQSGDGQKLSVTSTGVVYEYDEDSAGWPLQVLGPDIGYLYPVVGNNKYMLARLGTPSNAPCAGSGGLTPYWWLGGQQWQVVTDGSGAIKCGINAAANALQDGTNSFLVVVDPSGTAWARTNTLHWTQFTGATGLKACTVTHDGFGVDEGVYCIGSSGGLLKASATFVLSAVSGAPTGLQSLSATGSMMAGGLWVTTSATSNNVWHYNGTAWKQFKTTYHMSNISTAGPLNTFVYGGSVSNKNINRIADSVILFSGSMTTSDGVNDCSGNPSCQAATHTPHSAVLPGGSISGTLIGQATHYGPGQSASQNMNYSYINGTYDPFTLFEGHDITFSYTIGFDCSFFGPNLFSTTIAVLLQSDHTHFHWQNQTRLKVTNPNKCTVGGVHYLPCTYDKAVPPSSQDYTSYCTPATTPPNNYPDHVKWVSVTKPNPGFIDINGVCFKSEVFTGGAYKCGAFGDLQTYPGGNPPQMVCTKN